jgi:hypothetical protein
VNDLDPREPRISPRRFLLLAGIAGLGFFVAIVAVGMLGVAGLYLYTRCDQAGECDKQPFESEAWKTASDQHVLKIRMVDDLIENYDLDGQSREFIDELLGPARSGFLGNCDYVYWLGPERGVISIDSEWLCINFDGDVVRDHKIISD